MRRALAVTPIHVPADEIARRQARYDRLAPPGLEITLRDVGRSAPSSLNTGEDMRSSERAVAGALSGVDGWDLAFPDCVLDPAVPDAVAGGRVPVHGLLKLSAGHLAANGVRFGAVVRNEAIGVELGRRLEDYGHARHLAGVETLDLPFDAVADTQAWNVALTGAVSALAGAGATAVLNGCSAVDVQPAELAARVVDPTALALRVLMTEAGT